MRALVYQNNALRLEKDYQQPITNPGEALIRVLQAGICNTDLEITHGYMNFQGIPGHEFVGIVERNGAFAEYLTLPLENLHLVPDNVSDEEAVFVEPLAANFEILEQVHLKPSDSVVVLGDGKMGQLAAQVLALVGCEVIMVGKHKEKLALAEKRGVHPSLLTDAKSFVLENGRRVDVVIECSGSPQGLELAMRLVR